MSNKTKEKIDALCKELAERKELHAPKFFALARASKWGKRLTSDELIEGYNASLGYLFARGELSWQEVKDARDVPEIESLPEVMKSEQKGGTV